MYAGCRKWCVMYDGWSKYFVMITLHDDCTERCVLSEAWAWYLMWPIRLLDNVLGTTHNICDERDVIWCVSDICKEWYVWFYTSMMRHVGLIWYVLYVTSDGRDVCGECVYQISCKICSLCLWCLMCLVQCEPSAMCNVWCVCMIREMRVT
jgi:hypothetical protein